MATPKIQAQKEKAAIGENRGFFGLNMIALSSTYLVMRMHTLRLSRYSCKGVAVGKREIGKTVHIRANYMGFSKLMSMRRTPEAIPSTRLD
jgi:hypothetical protein